MTAQWSANSTKYLGESLVIAKMTQTPPPRIPDDELRSGRCGTPATRANNLTITDT